MNSADENAVAQLTEAIQKASLESQETSPSDKDKNADDDRVLTPFESVASAILDLLADMRRMHDAAYVDHKESKSASTSEGSNSRNRASPAEKQSVIRRFFSSLRRASPESETTTPQDESTGPRPRPPRDVWDVLLDSTAMATNRLVTAHIIVETEETVRKTSPPLFWLLYNGHR